MGGHAVWEESPVPSLSPDCFLLTPISHTTIACTFNIFYKRNFCKNKEIHIFQPCQIVHRRKLKAYLPTLSTHSMQQETRHYFC